MSKKHLHWVFVAFDERGKFDKTQILYAVTVTVEGQATEKAALRKAKQLVKRKYYFLQKTYECSTCAFQEKYLKEMKKLHE